MKNNFKETPSKDNNAGSNKALFGVLVVIAALLAVAIVFSFFNIQVPSTGTNEESAGASFSGTSTATSLTLGNRTNCTDSDGGIVPYISGIVKYKGKSYSDNCTNTSILKEYYCYNNSAAHVYLYCYSGCRSGACINETNVVPAPLRTMSYESGLPGGESMGAYSTASSCYELCILRYSETYCWDRCYFPQGV